MRGSSEAIVLARQTYFLAITPNLPKAFYLLGGNWTPHKVELAVWAHYVAVELKPELLDEMPGADASNGKSIKTNGSSKKPEATVTSHAANGTSAATSEDDSNLSAEDSNLSAASLPENGAAKSQESSSIDTDETSQDTNGDVKSANGDSSVSAV